jgi:hypothetical protein
MPGRGPAPKPADQRRTRHAPQRGDWQATPGIGWQHGPIPDPPEGVHADTRRAWDVWMRSWFAAHWTPDDLPGLEHLAGLHSEVRTAFHDPFMEAEGPRGGTIYVRRPSPNTELRQMLDNYGVTPKGQQDRRWSAPKAEPEAAPVTKSSRYAHLRTVAS